MWWLRPGSQRTPVRAVSGSPLPRRSERHARGRKTRDPTSGSTGSGAPALHGCQDGGNLMAGVRWAAQVRSASQRHEHPFAAESATLRLPWLLRWTASISLLGCQTNHSWEHGGPGVYSGIRYYEAPPRLKVVRSARYVVSPTHSGRRSSRSCSFLQSMQNSATGRARRRSSPISSPQLSHWP